MKKLFILVYLYTQLPSFCQTIAEAPSSLQVSIWRVFVRLINLYDNTSSCGASWVTCAASSRTSSLPHGNLRRSGVEVGLAPGRLNTTTRVPAEDDFLDPPAPFSMSFHFRGRDYTTSSSPRFISLLRLSSNWNFLINHYPWDEPDSNRVVMSSRYFILFFYRTVSFFFDNFANFPIDVVVQYKMVLEDVVL